MSVSDMPGDFSKVLRHLIEKSGGNRKYIRLALRLQRIRYNGISFGNRCRTVVKNIVPHSIDYPKLLKHEIEIVALFLCGARLLRELLDEAGAKLDFCSGEHNLGNCWRRSCVFPKCERNARFDFCKNIDKAAERFVVRPNTLLTFFRLRGRHLVVERRAIAFGGFRHG